MMLRQRRLRRQETEVNPMDGVANLADAMLVLAVGIMLALILNWNVDISAVRGQADPETEEALTFTEEDLTQSEAQEGQGELKKLGAVYYDPETGLYYIIEEETP
jgi:hypothetical protein